MCRLFGLYANKPVDVYFSFFESPVGSLVELSYDNPSGWVLHGSTTVAGMSTRSLYCYAPRLGRLLGDVFVAG